MVGRVVSARLESELMQRTRVSSSNLAEAGYDLDSQTLEIRFHHGGVYQYYGVPHSVFAGLMAAPSKGRYHHRNIKWKYRYKRVRF